MQKGLAIAVCLIGLGSLQAGAQPVLSSTQAAFNSASYLPLGLPSSGVAQGSIFSIFGQGLGSAAWTPAGSFPLPAVLAGTSVSVTGGGVTQPAILLGVNQSQINAIMPSSIPAGDATLTVTYNGQSSAATPVHVSAAAFGIYTFGSTGAGQAIATGLDNAVNTVIHPFHPGDVGILWGTGLGPITASDAGAPPVGNLPGTVQVFVGNTAAKVTYHGRSGCCAGLDQIVFTVPQGVEGCYVPLAVTAGGTTSNFTTIAVASGDACTDSILGPDMIARLKSGQKVRFGYVRLEDDLLKFVKGSTAASISDVVGATFSEITPSTAGLAEYGVSSGGCMAVACPGFVCGVPTPFSLMDLSPAQLDAGSSLTIATGANTVAVPNAFAGSGDYWAQLNPSFGRRFLWSGEQYDFTGAGGSTVGSFSVTDLTGDALVQFSNLTPAQVVPRNADLSLTWTGGDPNKENGQVVIGGYSANSDYSLLTYFQCTAPVTANQVTIPARVLSMLPPSASGQSGTFTYPLGWIWIGQYNDPVTFQAAGLDRAIITDVFWNGYGIYFQ